MKPLVFSVVVAIILSPALADLQKNHFEKNFLKTANKLRRSHSAPPLTLDPELMKEAQKWVDRLVEANQLEANAGANLCVYIGQVPDDYCVKFWYNGINTYNFKDPKLSIGSGSFSQLVWKDSRKLGIAKATNPKTKITYEIAIFTPKGNLESEFKQNVLPRKNRD